MSFDSFAYLREPYTDILDVFAFEVFLLGLDKEPKLLLALDSLISKFDFNSHTCFLKIVTNSLINNK